MYIRAIELNPLASPLRIRLPASQLRGLSASGDESSAITARQTDCSVQAGVQASTLRMSRQISPVCDIARAVQSAAGGGGGRVRKECGRVRAA